MTHSSVQRAVDEECMPGGWEGPGDLRRGLRGWAESGEVRCTCRHWQPESAVSNPQKVQ